MIGNKVKSRAILAERSRNQLPDITTAAGVRALERQLNTGQLFFGNGDVDVSITNIKGAPCEFSTLLREFQQAGRGTYAQAWMALVRQIPEIIIKRALYSTKVSNVFNGTLTERRMMQLLSIQFVFPGITPHLPPLYGHAWCKNALAKNQDGEVLLISSYARFGTLLTYLTNHATDNIVRQVIFEMAYTFAAIQKTYPRFCHNDIKLNNILATAGPYDGYTEYQYEQEVYFIPNSGVRTLLWDFDMASILGTLDNEKATTLQMESPELSVSPWNSAGTDLKLFVKHIVWYFKNNISADMLQEIQQTWPDFVQTNRAYPEAPYLRVYQSEAIPSPVQVLRESPLFRLYRAQERSIQIIRSKVQDNYKCIVAQNPANEVVYFAYDPKESFTPSMPLGFGSAKPNLLSRVVIASYYQSTIVPTQQTAVYDKSTKQFTNGTENDWERSFRVAKRLVPGVDRTRLKKSFDMLYAVLGNQFYTLDYSRVMAAFAAYYAAGIAIDFEGVSDTLLKGRTYESENEKRRDMVRLDLTLEMGAIHWNWVVLQFTESNSTKMHPCTEMLKDKFDNQCIDYLGTLFRLDDTQSMGKDMRVLVARDTGLASVVVRCIPYTDKIQAQKLLEYACNLKEVVSFTAPLGWLLCKDLPLQWDLERGQPYLLIFMQHADTTLLQVTFTKTQLLVLYFQLLYGIYIAKWKLGNAVFVHDVALFHSPVIKQQGLNVRITTDLLVHLTLHEGYVGKFTRIDVSGPYANNVTALRATLEQYADNLFKYDAPEDTWQSIQQYLYTSKEFQDIPQIEYIRKRRKVGNLFVCSLCGAQAKTQIEGISQLLFCSEHCGDKVIGLAKLL